LLNIIKVFHSEIEKNFLIVRWSLLNVFIFSQPKESSAVNSAALTATSLLIAKALGMADLRREFLRNYFAKFANLLLDLLSEANFSCQVTLCPNIFNPKTILHMNFIYMKSEALETLIEMLRHSPQSLRTFLKRIETVCVTLLYNNDEHCCVVCPSSKHCRYSIINS
jgi:hypothetical protein